MNIDTPNEVILVAHRSEGRVSAEPIIAQRSEGRVSAEPILPNEIIYLIGEQIFDKRTFHAFALCFPGISRALRNKKEKQFAPLFFKCEYDPFSYLRTVNAPIFGRRINFNIPRRSDLLNNVYLNIELPNNELLGCEANSTRYAQNISHQLTSKVNIEFNNKHLS